jgi:hypothetical protein
MATTQKKHRVQQVIAWVLLLGCVAVGIAIFSALSHANTPAAKPADVTHQVRDLSALSNNTINFTILWYNKGKGPGGSDCILQIEEPDGNSQTYEVSTTGGAQALANGVIQPTDSNSTGMTVTVTPGQASLITPSDFQFSSCVS